MKVYNEGTPYVRTEYEFSDLIGKTLIAVRNVDDQEIIFETGDEVFKLYHGQDCCESVTVESITGDLQDLIGTPILVAEERSDTDDPPDISEQRVEKIAKGDYWYDADSQTWTFYTLRTIKGSVDIRWYGHSNGYYSEHVDFGKV